MCNVYCVLFSASSCLMLCYVFCGNLIVYRTGWSTYCPLQPVRAVSLRENRMDKIQWAGLHRYFWQLVMIALVVEVAVVVAMAAAVIFSRNYRTGPTSVWYYHEHMILLITQLWYYTTNMIVLSRRRNTITFFWSINSEPK